MGRHMVTFKEFKTMMQHIITVNDMIDDLDAKYHISAIDTDISWLCSDVADLLSKLLKDKADTLSWWCWETNFGRDTEMCIIQDVKTGKEVAIDTIEKIWLYLTDEEKLWKQQ